MPRKQLAQPGVARVSPPVASVPACREGLLPACQRAFLPAWSSAFKTRPLAVRTNFHLGKGVLKVSDENPCCHGRVEEGKEAPILWPRRSAPNRIATIHEGHPNGRTHGNSSLPRLPDG